MLRGWHVFFLHVFVPFSWHIGISMSILPHLRIEQVVLHSVMAQISVPRCEVLRHLRTWSQRRQTATNALRSHHTRCWLMPPTADFQIKQCWNLDLKKSKYSKVEKSRNNFFFRYYRLIPLAWCLQRSSACVLLSLTLKTQAKQDLLHLERYVEWRQVCWHVLMWLDMQLCTVNWGHCFYLKRHSIWQQYLAKGTINNLPDTFMEAARASHHGQSQQRNQEGKDTGRRLKMNSIIPVANVTYLLSSYLPTCCKPISLRY